MASSDTAKKAAAAMEERRPRSLSSGVYFDAPLPPEDREAVISFLAPALRACPVPGTILFHPRSEKP